MSPTPESIARAKRGVLLVGGPMAGCRVDPAILGDEAVMNIEVLDTARGEGPIHVYRVLANALVGFYLGRKGEGHETR